MPDAARERVSPPVELTAQRAQAARSGAADLRGPPAGGTSPGAAARPNGSFTAWLLTRLDDAMRSVPMRRLIGGLGAIVTLMTVLSYPVGYGVISYWKDAALLDYSADLAAAQAAGFIHEYGLEYEATWRRHAEQLSRRIDDRTPAGAARRVRVVTPGGTVVVEKGGALARPTFSAHAPITVGDKVMGGVEVAASLQPLLVQVGLIALFSLTLGGATFLVFSILPLRVLDRTLASLETANAMLQRQNLLLDTALANMFQGLAMFDAEERLVIANARFAEMYGLSPQQAAPGTSLRAVVEARIAHGVHSGATAEEQLRILRQHLLRRKVSHLAERLSDGRAILVSIRPMPEGGWVTTHQDVTERENLNAELAQHNELLRSREDQLEAQNKLLDAAAQEQYRSWSILDAALNNMPQGLAMFDANRRLIVCNRVYHEMYGLTAEEVGPGVTSGEVLDLRVARGIYGDVDPRAFIDDWRAADKVSSARVYHLADGRIVSVCRHAISDGRFLITHEDITERERLNVQLAEQHELVKQREDQLTRHNEQFDAALKNMSQGLSMFDADMRLVICNDLFARMHGLTSDQVRPGTTLRRIVELQVAGGCRSDESGDEILGWIAGRAAGKGPASFVSELKDGRSIAVSAQQMPGGGIVTTFQDITEQRYAEARIVHMALHDTLTDLPNRMLLNERLEHSLTRVRRGEVVAVHMLDLDHFKTVNDTLGHAVGDTLLRLVTDRLRELVRETDTVARIGGDEFAVVQVAISQPGDATTLAQRMIEVLSAPYEIEGQQVEIGATIGIAMGPEDGTTPAELLRNADLALYRAKGDGRGTFCFFESQMDAQMQARRAFEYDLRRAVLAGEFELHYQPIVELESDAITGFEALIRWRHPKNGVVLPSTFIPLAEKIGVAPTLGEWAIRTACETAMQWPEDLAVAVNLSPSQFRNSSLPQIVADALAASGLPAHRLELDITEPVLLGENEAALAALVRLRQLGVRLAMDDFGTGYSSLSHLQSFRFDKIKIDCSFVKSVTGDLGALNIVRAVTALAHSLGMKTTAEGVETLEQLEIVKSEGCTEMQGFLFSPAVPGSDIERLLRRKRRRQLSREAEDAA